MKNLLSTLIFSAWVSGAAHADTTQPTIQNSRSHPAMSDISFGEEYPKLTRQYVENHQTGFCDLFRCYIYSPTEAESCKWVAYYSC